MTRKSERENWITLNKEQRDLPIDKARKLAETAEAARRRRALTNRNKSKRC